MDHANEEWLKLYRRKTAKWRSLEPDARLVALELSMEMGRFTDEISLGPKGLRAVCALVSMPWERVEAALAELIAVGDLVYDQVRQVLRDPQHLDRQQSASSPAQRKRDQRAAERASTKPDITPSHIESRAVTPCPSGVTIRGEEREETEERETRAREEPSEPEPEPEDEPDRSPLDAPMPPWAEQRIESLAATNLIDVAELDPPPLIWSSYVGSRVRDGQPLSEPDFYGFVSRWLTRWKSNRSERIADRARRDEERSAEEQRRDRARRGTMSPPVKRASEEPGVPPPREVLEMLATLGGGAAP